MAIMPAAFVAAQDKGISTVKDGQTAVGNTFNTDTAKQHPRLRPADWRKCFDDFSYEPERHHPATLRGTCSHRTDVQRRTQFVLQAATIL